MNKKLLRIILSAVLLLAAWLVNRNIAMPVWGQLLVYLVPYLIVGYDVLGEAWEGIREGDPFDEDFLMAVATIGALLIGFLPGAEPQFPEAVFVMLFFQVGELFEDYAEDRSRESITKLMDIRPDTANVERGGQVTVVAPADVKVGETIVVKPGEKIPLDGTVVEGCSSLDTVALTGESIPRGVDVGGEVISGCVNISGVLRIKTTKSFGESTASKIVDLVENASANKSRSETFITRFAHVYTPIVVFMALALAFIPPFFSPSYADAFGTWLYRALTFLVVSCPCALVISVPLTFFGGIGGASRRGILIKGGNYMDVLARCSTVVFDKTGTLTKGVFAVDAVHPDRMDANELLHLAAHVERFSTHPIAAALRQAYPDEHDNCRVENIEEVAGYGVQAMINGHRVCVGNEKMMRKVGALGVQRTVMLTGDHEQVGMFVADTLGLDEYHAGLLPADKVEHVERLLREKPAGTSLAFVGDGINDAPVLARADVGIAMGALGSDAAIEAADVVLMDDKPSKIAVAIRTARHTLRIARQNAGFAIGVKVAILVLAAFGLAGMGLAVFGDVGVMVLCVINATRALRA